MNAPPTATGCHNASASHGAIPIATRPPEIAIAGWR